MRGIIQIYKNVYVFYDLRIQKNLKKGETVNSVIIERIKDVIY